MHGLWLCLHELSQTLGGRGFVFMVARRLSMVRDFVCMNGHKPSMVRRFGKPKIMFGQFFATVTEVRHLRQCLDLVTNVLLQSISGLRMMVSHIDRFSKRMS